MNDFHEQLKEASDPKHDVFFRSAYDTFFGNVSFMSGTFDDIGLQRKGYDRLVILSNEKKYIIDEKIRKIPSAMYNDILLEYESSPGNVGWIEKDLSVDYIAYAFTDHVYMLNWVELKRLWRHLGKIWIKQLHIVEAQNPNYVTKSVAVPIDKMKEYLGAIISVKIEKL